MNIDIDGDTMLAALEAVVEKRGADFVYKTIGKTGQACFYAQNGAPSCGVGQALFDLGVSIDVLEALDANYGNSAEILSESSFETLTDSGVLLTDEALMLAVGFQEAQDRGEQYNVALMRAKDALKNRVLD